MKVELSSDQLQTILTALNYTSAQLHSDERQGGEWSEGDATLKKEISKVAYHLGRELGNELRKEYR